MKLYSDKYLTYRPVDGTYHTVELYKVSTWQNKNKGKKFLSKNEFWTKVKGDLCVKMNEGWEELKKAPRRSKADQKGPQNVWNPNSIKKILKRNPTIQKPKNPEQSLEDKTLWPTLGATGIIICFWISWIHLLNEKWKFNISFCFQIAIKQSDFNY